MAAGVFQLAHVSTDDAITEGVIEIHSLLSNGSSQNVLLHEPMLIIGLASSPEGEQHLCPTYTGGLKINPNPGISEHK